MRIGALLGLALLACPAAAAEPDFAALTERFVRAVDARDGAAMQASYCPGAAFMQRG